MNDAIKTTIDRETHTPREGWNKADAWPGAEQDKLLLKDMPDAAFDQNGDWEW